MDQLTNRLSNGRREGLTDRHFVIKRLHRQSLKFHFQFFGLNTGTLTNILVAKRIPIKKEEIRQEMQRLISFSFKYGKTEHLFDPKTKIIHRKMRKFVKMLAVFD